MPDIFETEPTTDFTPQVVKFDDQGDPIEPKAEAAPATPAAPAATETPAAPAPGDEQAEVDWKQEAGSWRQLATEQQEQLDELSSALPLLRKLKEDPGSADLIQAFLSGKLDKEALLGKASSKQHDELDEWLSRDENIDQDDGVTEERKASADTTGEVDKESEEYKGIVKSLNSFAVDKRGEGYSEADVHRFLKWLPEGKPRPEDLWYAFVAQCRREGRSVQPVRSQVKDLAVEGLDATGGSDRPTPETPMTLEEYRSMGFHEQSGNANEI